MIPPEWSELQYIELQYIILDTTVCDTFMRDHHLGRLLSAAQTISLYYALPQLPTKINERVCLCSFHNAVSHTLFLQMIQQLPVFKTIFIVEITSPSHGHKLLRGTIVKANTTYGAHNDLYI